jgi:hypothetical protein
MATVSAFAAASPPGFGRRKTTLEDHLIARMLGRSLDRELAAGVSLRVSTAHAARAKQLTTDRTRRAVANRLERLVERAKGPVSRFQLTSVPSRDQVHEANCVIRAIAARLRSAEPLEARGIACLKTLLSDPAGPCYAPSRPRELTVTLHDISKLLDVVG